MAFSDFKTIADVQRKYGIRYLEKSFIATDELTPPESFVRDLQFYRETIDIFSSEASRSEIVISPLLREVYKSHHAQCSFWIQKPLAFDETLCGTPDYMVSGRSELGKTVLEKPVLIIVEAKKNDFEQGWGQCLAELWAAERINNDRSKPVYGVVTDANLWQFGKLLDNEFCREPANFTIDALPRLYGALEYLFKLAEREQTPMNIPQSPGMAYPATSQN
jgi:hypothetical protein